MSPFPLAGCLPGVLKRTALDETRRPVTPDYTGMSSVWEDQAASTTNMYADVNDSSDSTYVTLQSVIPDTVICGTSTEEHNFRCNMDPPSGKPRSDQSIIVTVRARYVDLYTATNEEHTMEIEVIQGTSTQRAYSSGHTLTTSFADYELFMSTSEINSVTDWDDLDVKATITSCAGDSLPNAGDQQLEISEVYITYAP